jgi:hypothetical protein
VRNAKGKRVTRASQGLKPGKWGGKQPNGGRKPGNPNARSKVLRAIADEALMDGVKPVEALLRNMRWYFAKANRLCDEFEHELAEKGPTPEVKELLVESMMYRDKSQSCAVEAAPYFHPRLSAIAVGITSDRRLELPPNLPLNEAMSQYEENLRRFPKPGDDKQIEHEPVSLEKVKK